MAEAQGECCANLKCAGFSFPKPGTKGSGDFKGNAMGGFTKNKGYDGYTKPNQIVHVPPPPPTPPSAPAADITIDFAMVDLHGAVEVFDIWQVRHARHATRSLYPCTACIVLHVLFTLWQLGNGTLRLTCLHGRRRASGASQVVSQLSKCRCTGRRS